MAMTPKTFGFIRQLVLARSAIVLEPGKEYLVESRLGPLAKVHGFATLDDFADAMTVAPFGTMHRQTVEAMTTNETSFFRDIHPFEALKKSAHSGDSGAEVHDPSAQHLVRGRVMRTGALLRLHAPARALP